MIKMNILKFYFSLFLFLFQPNGKDPALEVEPDSDDENKD